MYSMHYLDSLSWFALSGQEAWPCCRRGFCYYALIKWATDNWLETDFAEIPEDELDFNKQVIPPNLYHHSPAENVLTYYSLILSLTNKYFILVMQIHPSLIMQS